MSKRNPKKKFVKSHNVRKMSPVDEATSVWRGRFVEQVSFFCLEWNIETVMCAGIKPVMITRSSVIPEKQEKCYFTDINGRYRLDLPLMYVS